MADKTPEYLPPSWSTDPTPRNRERAVDGLIRAAANLATVQIPGPVGEQVRILLWAHYNTSETRLVETLARAIVNEQQRRKGDRRG